MYPVEQCPSCGSFTEGSPAYETSRTFARTGVKFASKKVLINYIALPILGTFIFPVFGTIIGFVIAFFVGIYIEKKADQITDSVDLTINSSTPFNYKCSHCGKTWSRTYQKGIDYTTDAVLKREKRILAEDIRNDASSNLFYSIFAGIIGLPCAFYCLTHLSDQSSYFLWWILFIIGFPAIIIAINCGIKTHNMREEADDLESMSASDFRNSAYRAGNPFVGKFVDIYKKDCEEKQNKPKELPHPQQTKVIEPTSEVPTKIIEPVSPVSTKDNLAKLEELLESGILSEEEYAEQKIKMASSDIQATVQNNEENNKITILKKLKMLLDSGILSNKEFKGQKASTLSVISIPWDKGKSKYEILEEMKSLHDASILTQEEFEYHKKAVLSDNQSSSFSGSANDNLKKLEGLFDAGVITNDEYNEEKKLIATHAFHSAKKENNKIAILKSLKMLLDTGYYSIDEFKNQKRSTLSVVTIPWDEGKSNYEILEEMKSLLDADILTQEEFDYHKKSILNNN